MKKFKTSLIITLLAGGLCFASGTSFESLKISSEFFTLCSTCTSNAGTTNSGTCTGNRGYRYCSGSGYTCSGSFQYRCSDGNGTPANQQ